MVAYATLPLGPVVHRPGDGRASGIEKATSNVKKEVRGVAGESHAATADRDTAAAAASAALSQVEGLSAAPFAASAALSEVERAAASDSSQVTSPTSQDAKRVFTAAEKTTCSIEAMKNGEECEACQ